MPGEWLDSPGIVYISGVAMYRVLRNERWINCAKNWKNDKFPQSGALGKLTAMAVLQYI